MFVCVYFFQIADSDLNVARQQTKLNINYFNYSLEVIFKVTSFFQNVPKFLLFFSGGAE